MNDLVIRISDTDGALAKMELNLKGDHYDFHIRDFLRWMRESGRELKFPETVQEYMLHLNDSGLSPSTIACRRAAVKKRMAALIPEADVETRLMVRAAMQEMGSGGATKAPTKQDQGVDAERCCSPAEMQALMAGARSERQQMFMKFLWSTGVRIAELLAIEIKDCKPFKDRVFVQLHGKGKKERRIWITRDLYRELRDFFGNKHWLEKRQVEKMVSGKSIAITEEIDHNYLFKTSTGKSYSRNYISDQIAKLAEHVLGRRISAHYFRHGFASTTIQQNGTNNIAGLSNWLGHSKTSTTLDMYVHGKLTDNEVMGVADLANVSVASIA